MGMPSCAVVTLSLQVAALSTVLSFGVCLQQNSLYKSGDVMLGGLFPIHITRQDDYSCSGFRPEALIWAEAMVFAIDEINRNDTFLPNITLGYSICDTCGSEQTAMASAADFSFTNTLIYNSRYKTAYNDCSSVLTETNKTIKAPFVAVIGGEDSRISINVANVLQLNDIPQISYGATSSVLSNDQFTTFFRTVPPDQFQSQAMADIVTHNKWTCVALIGTDDLYGRSGVNAFVDAAAAGNICIASKYLFPVHDPREKIKEMIKHLQKMPHVEIVILYSLPAQAVSVFEEVLRQGLTGKTWIASDGWAKSSYIRQKRFIPIIQGTIGLEFRDVQFEALRKHIESAHHNGVWWGEFWSEFFNCSVYNNKTKPLCSGAERIGKDLYESRLRGPLIAYVRDAVYSAAYALESVLKCTRGRDCRNALKSARPENVLTALREISFHGLTGHLDFSKQEAQAKYDIVNLQTKNREFKVVNVGTWNAQKLELRDGDIQWCANKRPRSTCGDVCRPGTYKSSTIQCIWECVPCSSLSGDRFSSLPGSTDCKKCEPGYLANENHTDCYEVPPKYINPTDTWGIALLTITCFCILGTLIVIAIFIRHANTPVVCETGRLLNFLLLFEILFSYLFNILLLQKPSDGSCFFLGVWFYFIYTSAVVTFILKIYHIRRRMDLPKKISVRLAHHPDPCSVDAKRVKPMWYFYVLGCGTSIIPLILAVLWAQFDGSSVGKVVLSRAVVYYTCKSLNTSHGLFLRIFNVLFLAILALAGTIYAYRTNKIPQVQKFREAKHLAYSMTLFLVTLYTFYPGWVLIQGPVLQVFACSTNLIAASGVILCAYGPKVHLIYFNPVLNASSHIRPSRSSITDAAVCLGMGVTVMTTSRGRSVTLIDSSQSTPPSTRLSRVSFA